MASSVGITLMNTFCSPASKFFASYVNYMDREEAIKKEHILDFDLLTGENFDLFSRYMDYMGNPQKAHAQERPEKISGLFTADMDSLSKEEIKSLKSAFRTAQNSGSLMWQTVLSFDNDWLCEMGVYAKENGLDEKRFRICARAAIGKLLESESLKNALWTASIHYNTDNIHVHVGIVEPEPMRKKKKFKQWKITQKDGKWQYLREKDPVSGQLRKVPLLDQDGRQLEKEEYIGKFKPESLRCAKAEMVRFLLQEKDVHQQRNQINQKIREQIVGSLKAYTLYEDEAFRESFMQLYEKLPADKRAWRYGYQKMMPLRHDLDQLSNAYIQKFCKKEFEMFAVNLRKKEEEYQNAYGGEKNHCVENQLRELYTRMGNAILFSMRMYEKKQQLDVAGGSAEKESLLPPDANSCATDAEHKNQGKNSRAGRTQTTPSRAGSGRGSTSGNSLRSVLLVLKHSLDNTTEKILNQQEYERLQKEIGGGNIDYEQMQGDWYHHMS